MTTSAVESSEVFRMRDGRVGDGIIGSWFAGPT